jgi:chromate reductase
VTLLGIAGSLRADSLNAQLLRLVAEELPQGVELELYDGLAAIPPFDQDLEHDPPESVTRLKRAIASTEAVVIATPEYNGSIPGQLKNALDWVSRPRRESPIQGKPVAVIGASTGQFGALWAQRDLKRVLGIMGARVLAVELPVAKADRRLAEPDPELRQQLAAVADALVPTTLAATVAA